jgi:hypothetical protein
MMDLKNKAALITAQPEASEKVSRFATPRRGANIVVNYSKIKKMEIQRFAKLKR